MKRGKHVELKFHSTKQNCFEFTRANCFILFFVFSLFFFFCLCRLHSHAHHKPIQKNKQLQHSTSLKIVIHDYRHTHTRTECLKIEIGRMFDTIYLFIVVLFDYLKLHLNTRHICTKWTPCIDHIWRITVLCSPISFILLFFVCRLCSVPMFVSLFFFSRVLRCTAAAAVSCIHRWMGMKKKNKNRRRAVCQMPRVQSYVSASKMEGRWRLCGANECIQYAIRYINTGESQ